MPTDIFKVWHLPEPYFSLSLGRTQPYKCCGVLRGRDGAGGGDERTGDSDGGAGDGDGGAGDGDGGAGADDGGAGADDGDNGTGESDDDSHDGDSKGSLVNANSIEFKTFE